MIPNYYIIISIKIFAKNNKIDFIKLIYLMN